MEKVKYPTISIAKAPVANAIHTKNILNYSIALFKRNFLSDLNANSTVSEFINSFSLNFDVCVVAAVQFAQKNLTWKKCKLRKKG
jgi:hypothetical protein